MTKFLTAIAAVILGVALAFGTSAFKTPGNGHDADVFWVLKSGTIASTSPAAYQEGTDNCERDVHFCGFYAPEDGSSGQPVIPSSGALRNDLTNLSMDNNTPYNTSGDISFKDSE